MTTAILPTAYLGNIEYYTRVKSYDHHIIEIQETYPKQTYRNRCTIVGANGTHDLIIPVKKKSGEKTASKDIEIAYNELWQHTHWHAIKSAYNSSPFLEYYEDYFNLFYEKQFKFLVDFNLEIHELILKILKLNKRWSLSSEFIKPMDADDFRFSITPKKSTNIAFTEYYQVFSHRNTFVKNASIIDLIFNEGPRSSEFL